MTDAFALDHPEDTSLSIRIYPANGSANVAPMGSTTRVARVPNPPQAIPDSFSGPPQKFLPAPFGQSGPTQQTFTSVTTTTGPSTTVTTGAFAKDPVELTKFLAYDYDEQYLTPADGWTFQLSIDDLSDNERRVIKPGSRVEIIINDQVQSVGYIDEVRSTATGNQAP